MVDTTDEIIKSLQESPEGLDGVKNLNILQIQGVLKRLFVSQNEKDEENLNLKKKVQDLESKGNKTDLVIKIVPETAEEVHPIKTEYHSSFDTLFAKNVPHILEKIFLSLDYESFKACQRVNNSWNVLLTSASFIKKARTLFQKGIQRCIRPTSRDCSERNSCEIPRFPTVLAPLAGCVWLGALAARQQ